MTSAESCIIERDELVVYGEQGYVDVVSIAKITGTNSVIICFIRCDGIGVTVAVVDNDITELILNECAAGIKVTAELADADAVG